MVETTTAFSGQDRYTTAGTGMDDLPSAQKSVRNLSHR
jgi:hypothetical protein